MRAPKLLLALLLIPLLGISQKRQISGRITNEKGEGIPFASVMIQSSKTVYRRQ
jgi:hypothetical protein